MPDAADLRRPADPDGRELLAPASPRRRASRSRAVVLVAAALTLIAIFAVGDWRRPDGKKDTTASVSLLLSEAEYICVGVVTAVATGTFGPEISSPYAGDSYDIVTVRVENVLRGPVDAQIMVLYSAADRLPTERQVEWRTGSSILLFLDPSSGTAHEHVAPAHFQLTFGANGAWELRNGRLIDAPFSLEDVRTGLQ